jgi:BirA family biotin operon repressor/biotin-[acetyl-CoA-carboxylase] ligase
MKEIENIYYQYIKYGNFEAILDECRRYSVTLNKPVIVIGRDEDCEGFAINFDTDGSLLVKKQDGTITKVISGDVSVRGREGYV